MPGMFGEPPERDLQTEAQQAVLEALDEALDALNQVREREAAEIVHLMLRHNDSIRQTAYRTGLVSGAGRSRCSRRA